MGRERRLLERVGALALIGVSVAMAVGQSTRPADRELPPDVLTTLTEIEDFAFNFDQQGFYEVLQFVTHHPRGPGFQEEPVRVADWNDFLARPSAFRGRPVTISGIVGRKKDPYALKGEPDLGYIWQLELRHPAQRATITLVLTEDAGAIPMQAQVEATGYFVMVRKYYGASGRAQAAALIVAPGVTSIETRATHDPAVGHWPWIIGAGIVGLLTAVILLRRRTRVPPAEPRSLHARRSAPVNLSEDLEKWAADEMPAQPAEDRGAGLGEDLR